jgi:hypothetical protein
LKYFFPLFCLARPRSCIKSTAFAFNKGHSYFDGIGPETLTTVLNDTPSLLEQGTDLRYIQELLGHSSSKTAEIYTNVSKSTISRIRSPLANVELQKIGKNGRYVAGR